jgi:hypothetical protein
MNPTGEQFMRPLVLFMLVSVAALDAQSLREQAKTQGGTRGRGQKSVQSVESVVVVIRDVRGLLVIGGIGG